MKTPVSDGSVPKRSLRRKVNMKSYDENLMDELIEKHLGGSLKKKHRTKEELEKETEKEAMIAMSLGFPIDALLDEEIRAGVVSELGGKEQNDYIVVRNHILSRWRGNVRVWLSKGQIRETVSSEVEHLISSAYDFLLYNGYINFGVSSAFTSQIPEEASEGSVIIVGAGIAGLVVARQLLSFGFKVIVLEGRKRPGGRVYTQKMGEEGQFAAVELGGSVITGIHANPLGDLARQLSIPLHKDDPYEMGGDHCFLAGGNGRLIKALWEGIPILYEKNVHRIRYGNEGIQVIAGDQVFEADIVLCTVPLGVLKQRAINFEPELPISKTEAINKVDFGLLNKVAMVFPYVFWGEDLDTFGCLRSHTHD